MIIHSSLYKQRIKRILKTVLVDYSLRKKRRYIPLEIELKCDTIIDVGANFGQYADDKLALGFKGDIYSIEPLPYAHALLSKASQKYENWHVLKPLALSDRVASMEINVSENYASSTIENFTPEHLKIPGVKPLVKQMIDCVPFWKIYEDLNLDKKERIYFKIDTNGHEPQVLAGITEECLKNIVAFQIEIPIADMYQNQVGFDYYYNLMRRWDYILHDAQEGVRSTTGKNQIMDFIFLKSR